MDLTLDLVRKSFRENRVEDLLLGKDGFSLERPYMAPTDMPTDWLRLMDEGLFKFYEETDKSEFLQKLEDAMLALLDTPEGLYAVTSVLWVHIAREHRGAAPYHLPTGRILEKLSNNIRFMRSQLGSSRQWAGAQFENGLYGEVSRILSIMKEDFGIEILH